MLQCRHSKPVTRVTLGPRPFPFHLLPAIVAALLAFISQIGLGATDTWLWSTPVPHGNNIYDMTSSNGLAVQVGEKGRIYTSLDWDLWSPRSSGTTKALRGVAFFKGEILITGEEGIVVHAATDALTNFASIQLATTDWMESVAASTSLAVAVGDNGLVATTTDGANWQIKHPGTTWLRSVAFGNGTFVAVGETGFVATSADGMRWQQRTTGTTVNLNRVAWLGARFCVVGDGGHVMVSTDGTGASWATLSGSNPPTGDLYFAAGSGLGNLLVGGATELRLTESAGATWLNQLDSGSTNSAPSWTYFTGFYDGASFLVGGRTGMLVQGIRSTSGVEWITPSDSLRNWIWDLTQWQDSIVAVGDFGTVLSSTGGEGFDVEVLPAAVTSELLLGAAGSPQRIAAVGTRGTVVTSTNIVSWSQSLPNPTTNDLMGITWWSGAFLAVGGNGTILRSADGLAWSKQTSPTTAFLSGICAFPGGLTAVGDLGTVLTSTDGATWVKRPTNTTNWLYRTRWLMDHLVAVGEAGTILTSVDGMSWSTQATGRTNWLTDVAMMEGNTYVVGQQGTVLRSTNLTQWETVPSITQKALYAALATPHQLYAGGVEGVLVRLQTSPLAILDDTLSQGTNTVLLSGIPSATAALQTNTTLGSQASWTDASTFEFLANTGLAFSEIIAVTNLPPRRFVRARSLTQP